MKRTASCPVVIVSDGTGDTAKGVLDAAMRQFEGLGLSINYIRHVQDQQALHDAFERTAACHGILVSTLVNPMLRDEANQLAQRHKVSHVDLLGGVLDALTRYLNRQPDGVPNLLHRTDERYFRRVDAIEFTVASDDGRDPARLQQADLVLVGASRTGKTPLSTFLAHRGIRVANQPLWLTRPVPDALFSMHAAQVVGLTIDADALAAIRESRLRAQHVGTHGTYVDLDAIRAELEHVESLCMANGWLLIDVTHRAIEETATIIIQHLVDHGALHDHDGLFGV